MLVGLGLAGIGGVGGFEDVRCTLWSSAMVHVDPGFPAEASSKSTSALRAGSTARAGGSASSAVGCWFTIWVSRTVSASLLGLRPWVDGEQVDGEGTDEKEDGRQRIKETKGRERGFESEGGQR